MCSDLRNNLNELASAFASIRERLSNELSRRDSAKVPDCIENELRILYIHLKSITESVLLNRLAGSFHPYDEARQHNISDMAHEVVVEAFFAKGKRTDTLMIFDIVNGLFAKNPEPNGMDIFRYLTSTVKTQISNYNKRTLNRNNPFFSSTAKKIDYYIKNIERYCKRDGIVMDTFVQTKDATPFPSSEDVLRLTAGEPIPTNVAKAVDCIFDSLLKTPMFRSAVRISELRRAAYRMLEHRLIDGEFSVLEVSPKGNLLENMMHAARLESMEEAKSRYNQIDGYTKEELEAFLSAGNDYLYDYASKAKLEPLSKYLAMYIEECTPELYEMQYKGRFQHFIKTVFQSWQKKLRANTLVSLHIRGESVE